ncbi:hypothetical protein C0J52_07920 [Blattella germanica]|nr:hypothetical protein C0J52_07920 [Blattella germanica]
MATDEIEYNAYYHTLQNKFRRKYEQALSKCWTLCVPSTRALRGIDITEEFVDIHILRSSSSSSRDLARVSFVLIAFLIKFQEFQQYKIFIIDRPLSPKFKPEIVEDDPIHLVKIVSLTDAVEFLTRSEAHVEILTKLGPELRSLCPVLLTESLPNVRERMHDLMSSYWMALLKTHSLDRQRDARFQNLISISVENYIMSRIHDLVFQMVCSRYEEEDSKILSLVKELAGAGVTVDQLGAPEDFAVPLPAAVVELASLDSLNCPIDKLSCLRTTLDLILAELKGAIVDAHSVRSKDSQLPTLSTDDLIPLLVTVIIQAKPLHMASNLYYMENFQWSLSPSDATSFSLVTFKAAIQELLTLKPDSLRPRSEKVHRELGLEDLMKASNSVLFDKCFVTGEVTQRFERSGERKEEIPITPLDRQMERITAMIEASTQELSNEVMPIYEDVEQSRHALG